MKKTKPLKQAELIESMREALAHTRGQLTLKTTRVPQPARKMSPASIARLRRRLKASTPVFAAYLNVTADTVRSWEKNRRQPSGPSNRRKTTGDSPRFSLKSPTAAGFGDSALKRKRHPNRATSFARLLTASFTP